MRKKLKAIQDKYGIFKYISIFGIIGVPLGLLGGYLYYYYIGCRGGSCPITSNPWLSLLWGGILGYLIGDMFNNKTKKKEENPVE